MENLFLIL